MKNKSRIQNSLRNIGVGVGAEIVRAIAGFISRTVFIQTLGTEYLGINGLMTNILTVLSLLELGIGSSITFALYKPLAEGDKNKIQALIKLFKKYYFYIGSSIMILGLCLLPFLNLLIKEKPNITENIHIIYLLFLLNSVLIYFFAHNRTLIVADQRNYIDVLYKNIFFAIQVICQILILTFTKNYYLFLLILITCTLFNNIVITFKAKKLYPYIKNKNSSTLDKISKSKIVENIKALIMYRIGFVILDASENLIISAFVGIYWVGLYSNYILLISMILMFLTQINRAVISSVGNINAKESEEKKYQIFGVLNFTNFVLFSICSICLLCLSSPFIEMWLGPEYILGSELVFVIVLNFYIDGMLNAIWTYRSTMGLFVHGRYRPLISAVINIVCSIILVKKFGIFGVLISKTITRFLTNIWYDPYIIFKHGFGISVFAYYYQYLKYFLIVIFLGSVTYWLCEFFPFTLWYVFLLKIVICLIIPAGFIHLIFRKNYEYNYLTNICVSLLNKKIGK